MAALPSPSSQIITDSSVDTTAQTVIVIAMRTGKVHQLLAMENWKTTKSDQSEAGTFSVSGPLAESANLAYLQESSPMDIVAIYATRASNDPSAPAAASYAGPGTLLDSAPGWGAAGGTQTQGLQSATLLFLGVADDIPESYIQSDNSVSTLTITGRDFAKFLIENDIVMPYNATSVETLFNSTFPISSLTSISDVMYNILDTFVAKVKTNPNFAPGAGTITPATADALSFPWRNFISTAQQVAKGSYAPLSGSGTVQLPNFQVQTGSAWANLISLANAPLSRLFITEDGEFLVDDYLDAITTQTPISFIITTKEFVENASFSRSDANVATFFNVLGAQNAALNEYSTFGIMDAKNVFTEGGAVAANPGGGVTNLTPEETVQHFGVRQAQFSALYNTFIGSGGSSSAPPSPNDPRLRMFRMLQLMHNQLDVLTLTVKGRSIYRVGKRVKVGISFARASVSNATWYICNCEHDWSFGDVWTTTLTLRYPQAS